MRKALPIILGILGFAFLMQSQASGKPPFVSPLKYEDVFALEYAADPHFFSDSKRLLYTRRSMDIFSDTVRSGVWQIDVNTGEASPVLNDIPGLAQSTLSPDNTKLAYIASTDNGPQIFVHYLSLDKSLQITQLTTSPSHLTWSPDNKHLYFVAKVEAQVPVIFTDMPSAPPDAKWAEPARVINSIAYRADGGGYTHPGFTHVFRVSAEGGMVEQITQGEHSFTGPLTISPQSNSIVTSVNLTPSPELTPFGTDLVEVDITSKKMSQVTSRKGSESNPKISPNGKWLAYLHVEDKKMAYQLSELVLRNLESGEEQRLSAPLDRQTVAFEWAENSDYIVFSYLDSGETKLAEVRLNGDIIGLPVKVGGQALGRPYTSGEFALAKSGDVAFTHSPASHPAELHIFSRSGNITPLTALNEDLLTQRTMAEVDAIVVNSSIDNLSIDAWIAFPPGFDSSKRYPMILEIHGGPHAAYGPQFSMEVQLMAAQGYVVVWSNPRGSASYGADFGNLIHHNYPSNDYQDLMDVVDAVSARPYIDNDNLFITGGSGGGVLTAWSIGKTDRFNAAVVAKPVINWVSFALTADAYPYFSQYWMPDMPWNDHEALWKRSPLSLVGNVNTPTMLLTGEADYRTPISETEQYYQALKLRQIDTVMVRIPGAPHGITAKPSRLIQKVGNIVAWFNTYNTVPAKQ
ncbi:S9 family peptidase [Alteromonas sediminis]|uniref:S9 family peptidase n=1 Tax=Alteromonas sediminis TaxID=2259342 RepID=A0A3N5YBG3_9ALTE|nr:S9 family peptidase [Alteromonas sediminis]RPJ66315.1 S9 family peptidase [Alteromonas sediminis]